MISCVYYVPNILVIVPLPDQCQFSLYCVSTSLINIISINNIMAVILWQLCVFVIGIIICIYLYCLVCFSTIYWYHHYHHTQHAHHSDHHQQIFLNTRGTQRQNRLPTMQTSNLYQLQHPAARYWCRNRWGKGFRYDLGWLCLIPVTSPWFLLWLMRFFWFPKYGLYYPGQYGSKAFLDSFINSYSGFHGFFTRLVNICKHCSCVEKNWRRSMQSAHPPGRYGSNLTCATLASS